MDLSRSLNSSGLEGAKKLMLVLMKIKLEGLRTFEKNLRFHVKYCSREKLQYLVFSNFLLVLTIFSSWEEGWTLDYYSMEFWDFLKSYIVWQLVSQLLLTTIFINNNHVPLHLLWKKHLVRHQQVPKYYEHEHGCKFLKWHSLAMVLLILTKYISF